MRVESVFAFLLLTPFCSAEDAYFEVAMPPDEKTFVVRVADPAVIATAREVLAGRETDSVHVMGNIARVPAFYNPNWTFHLDPGSIRMFGFAMEVCDGAASEIGAHLAEVGGALLPNNAWCPWSSELVRELPAPTEAAQHITNVSTASWSGVAVAPGQIVSAFGEGLAASALAAEGLPLPEALGGVSVKVMDSSGVERPAGIFYVSPEQVNYVMPEATPGIVTVTVTKSDGAAASGMVEVWQTAPSLFTLDGARNGPATAWLTRVRADGTVRYESVAEPGGTLIPINLGPESDAVYLSLLGTGLRGRPDLSMVTVSLGGAGVVPEYVGPQTETPGLDQVNVLLPRELAGQGEIDVSITLRLEDRLLASNTVRISVQ